nr:carcinoembryonic antigen-related cell adhesion molecule 6-like isoform X3 [Microcebus murinus]XP_012616617.1 carcinoembryonic antigen-related cell adhesion molecule 6-like isoform X3 [Microcebus murinus]XP_012616624.1 carcinoembryonic antigen-related cell adhesion molecule 6-like isoform X3 [Microcebus murinus]
MEPPLGSPSRRRVPWQGLLLTVSLLTFWNPPAAAQLSVESVPLNAVEGKHVLLLAHNVPQDTTGYSWYKGDTVGSSYRIVSYVIDIQESITGPAYSGRETIYPNGSLLFQNVTLKDTGYYMLQIIRKNFDNKEVTGQLRVYSELPKPSITSNSSSPVEDEDSVALTCEPETQNTTYLWWKDGQRLQDSDRLVMSLDNRTLILIFITRNDTGSYQCGNWNPVSGSRSDPVTLNVLYGPDVPTISPPDSYYPLGANLHLSCHAASNPPAQYSWLINGSLQIPTQELFVPSVTMSHSGSYACVAHNSATGRNSTTVKNITVLEPQPVAQPSIHASSSTVTEDKDSVVLTCLTNDTGISIRWIFNNQSLQVTERMQLSQDNISLSINPVERGHAGGYQCEVSNPVSHCRSDIFRLTVEPKENAPGVPVGAIAGIVIGVLAGVALVAALGCVLFLRRTGRANGQRDLREQQPPKSISGPTASNRHTPSVPQPDPRTASHTYENYSQKGEETGDGRSHTLLQTAVDQCPLLRASPSWDSEKAGLRLCCLCSSQRPAPSLAQGVP